MRKGGENLKKKAIYRKSELRTRRSSDNQETRRKRSGTSSPNGGLAEDALRKNEERLSSFMESATDVFALFDPELNFVEINQAGLETWGVNKGDVIGKNIADVSPNLKETGRYEEYMDVIRTGKPLFIDDTSPHPISGDQHFSVKAFKVGEGLGIIITDITVRKRAERAVIRSLAEKEALLREVHHRVKNNMQVISSMLNLQSENIKDEQAREAFRKSGDRIKTMALIHEKLYQSEDFAGIDIGDYVQSLAKSLFHMYDVDPASITLKVNIRDVFLDISTAIPCGLIINELISNSLEHAFADGKEGEILIELSSDNKHSVLTVRDNGMGFPRDLDFRNTDSLGLQLVNTLVEQLDGRIGLDRRNGAMFTITFPGSREDERR
ncbi:MAG: histidine kinase dimerization/phosphoacceptor domain -containing protein [Thermoplasmata archaeon]